MLDDTTPDPVRQVIQSLDDARAIMENLDRWRPEIEKALKHGYLEYGLDHVVQGLLSGKLKLHAYDNCFFLVDVQQHALMKLYHVFLAGGDLDAVLAAIPDLKQDARENGCSKITINGRKGWFRVLQKVGAHSENVVMALEV